MRALAILTLVVVLVGGLAAAGNPIDRVRHGWDSFKGGYGSSSSGDRLVSGLGSNRYDFYRVALDEFRAHPLLGIGADNFQQQYLAHGHSDETPHYPHSVELRTLTQTGIVGGLFALIGLGGALVAASSALRSRDRLVRSVAGAALAGFGYWLVHGSFDWFWESPGWGRPRSRCSGSPARSRRRASRQTRERQSASSSPSPSPSPSPSRSSRRSSRRSPRPWPEAHVGAPRPRGALLRSRVARS